MVRHIAGKRAGSLNHMGGETMRKRNPELFWNVETLARALDVSLDEIMLFVRLELIPAAVRVHDVPLWRAADIRAWAKAARAATPAEAVATLWNAWQQDNDPRRNDDGIGAAFAAGVTGIVEPCCSTCKHFNDGRCYRYAPRPLTGLNFDEAAWNPVYPAVDYCHVCGDYQTKKDS